MSYHADYIGAVGGGTVFGRVIKWTINPMIVVNGIQPNTVTKVAFGEFVRLASRIIQIARKIQSPIQINQTRRKPPQAAAIAPFAAAEGVDVSTGVGVS